jgi:large subunit ribosomal protein L25
MKVVAQSRKEQGSGASRRLRHAAKVPGILYGGRGEPTPLAIDHNPLFHALRVEAFHSSILDMDLDGKPEQVLLRDIQWHPYKQQILHIDFQRVAADQPIVMKVPLHFTNQDVSPAVKLSAAIVSHVTTEITIKCLPGKLPSYIEVDLSNLEVGKTVHVEDIAFPEGVRPARPENTAVVTAVAPTVEEEAPAAAAAAAPAKPAAKGKK